MKGLTGYYTISHFCVRNRIITENLSSPSTTLFWLISCAFVEMHETQIYIIVQFLFFVLNNAWSSLEHGKKSQHFRPNGPPNSRKLEPSSQQFDGFGYRLATHLAWVGSSWIESGLNLMKLKFSPNASQVFHRLATSANSSQLEPSCFVIVRWLRGRSQTIEYFSCELARLGRTVWRPPGDASFDFVTWLELAWVGRTVWPGFKTG